VFDWGNTLMRVFPEYVGPMADWPKVELLPGVRQAMEALRAKYRLVLATGASGSGEGLVPRALQSVGLADSFEAIFTGQDLGIGKADPAFYLRTLEALVLHPDEVAVIGDDCEGDVATPAAVGLRTVWFNPEARPCPVERSLHTIHLLCMADLPGRLGMLAGAAQA